MSRGVPVLQPALGRRKVSDEEWTSLVQKALADAEDSQGRVNRASYNKGIGYVKEVVSRTDYDDVGVLVGELADASKDLVQCTASVLLDHLEVRQRTLEKNLACEKVEGQEDHQHFYQEVKVFVSLEAVLLHELFFLCSLGDSLLGELGLVVGFRCVLEGLVMVTTLANSIFLLLSYL